MAPKRKPGRPRTRPAKRAARDPPESVIREEEQEVASNMNVPPTTEQPIIIGEIQRRIRNEVRAEFAAREETQRKEILEMRQRLAAMERAQAAPPPPPPPVVVQGPVAPVQAVRVRIEEGGVTMFEFLKLGLPRFKGEANEDPRGFLNQVEKVARRLPCSEARTIELVGLLLEDQAWSWYQDHVEELIYVNNPISWEQFKRMMSEEFLSAGDREARMVQFERLKQGNMTVVEYASEFNRLSEFARMLVPDEASKVNRFLRGLNTSLYSTVAAGEYNTLTKLVDKTKRIESRLRDDSERKKKGKIIGQGGQGRESVGGFSPKGSDIVRPPHQRQFSMGNEQKFNREPTKSTGSRNPYEIPQRTLPRCSFCSKFHDGECRRKLGACLKCGQQGHFIRDCPGNRLQPMQTRDSQTTVQMNRPEDRRNNNGGRGQGTSGGISQSSAGRGQGRIFSMGHREIEMEDPVNVETDNA